MKPGQTDQSALQSEIPLIYKPTLGDGIQLTCADRAAHLTLLKHDTAIATRFCLAQVGYMVISST